jgi:hypothetical protein
VIKDIRIGFIDMRGLCSTFHHVLAMDENLDTSSLETEDEVAPIEGEVVWGGVGIDFEGCSDDVENLCIVVALGKRCFNAIDGENELCNQVLELRVVCLDSHMILS